MSLFIYVPLFFGLWLFLTIKVIGRRRALRAALGGDDFELLRRVRAHANAMEQMPFFLILIYMFDAHNVTVTGEYVVHFCCILFLVGRSLHAASLLKFEQYDAEGQMTAMPYSMRVFGMMFSLFAIIIAASSVASLSLVAW